MKCKQTFHFKTFFLILAYIWSQRGPFFLKFSPLSTHKTLSKKEMIELIIEILVVSIKRIWRTITLLWIMIGGPYKPVLKRKGPTLHKLLYYLLSAGAASGSHHSGGGSGIWEDMVLGGGSAKGGQGEPWLLLTFWNFFKVC